MRVFVTGVTGYIGGSVAARLTEGGHEVHGLTRDAAKTEALTVGGIVPVLGELDDLDLLAAEAAASDAVINCADADHLPSVVALIHALEGSGKALLHTSGSSVVGDDARGNSMSEAVYDETTRFPINERKRARHELNTTVLEAAELGVRSVVICPALIYGEGRGYNRDSIQVPFLVNQALADDVVRVVGKGLNRWSTVYIGDLEDLYARVLENAPAGSFYFAEHGETSFGEIGQAIADRLGMPGVESWDADEAAKDWGPSRAYFTFGSNSRVRANRAREELGWEPTHASVITWIANEMSIDEGARRGT